MQRDVKLGKIKEEVYTNQAVEILMALKKLGDELTAGEQDFLKNNANAAVSKFEQASGDVEGAGVLSTAGEQISRARAGSKN